MKPMEKRFCTSTVSAWYQELASESCASTLLKGTGTPKPVGYPARCASATCVPKPPAAAANEGLGPEGRKKVKNAGVPAKPTAAAGVQLAAAKPWRSAPGASRQMLP